MAMTAAHASKSAIQVDIRDFMYTVLYRLHGEPAEWLCYGRY